MQMPYWNVTTFFGEIVMKKTGLVINKNVRVNLFIVSCVYKVLSMNIFRQNQKLLKKGGDHDLIFVLKLDRNAALLYVF